MTAPTPPVDEVVALTCELVRRPTHHPPAGQPPSAGGDELALCRHLAPLLAGRGADEVRVVETGRAVGGPGGYVWARWGTPTLLLNVHVDTVPANTGWTRDPWAATVEDGRVWGLGACDTKGAIAAILCALDRAPARDLAVLFSGDEERGTAAVHAFLASPAAGGLRHAIVCEPTSRRAGLRHRGVLAHAATIRGRGGHSSRADDMPAPIVTMARLAVALDQLGRDHRGRGPADMPGLCMNVASIEGGVAFNVVPDAATLSWSVRPAPGFDRAAWDRQVAALAASIDPAITIETRLDHAPFACGDEAWARRILDGAVDDFVGLDFWTEAALLQAAGIDAVVVGPGDIGQAHAPDESVSIADLRWAADGFTTALERHAQDPR
ncbi:MAG: M20/M25/M40 family metallo-hydrolase [Kofleriaceae bacterium]|nr:M20/M25/M40 family metallo-hydrolase [Kofleriaceae bacterium]MCB9573613.1 M20/M25/M40 family metallo-hydrolase [Kofleriaceae bacterium]